MAPYFRLAYERRRQGLSQSQLALRANIAAPTVSAIERGRINPNTRELAALANVLGVADPAALMESLLVPELVQTPSQEQESVPVQEQGQTRHV